MDLTGNPDPVRQKHEAAFARSWHQEIFIQAKILFLA